MAPICRDLLDRLRAHVERSFRDWYDERNEQQVEGFLVRCVEMAVACGFERERDVARLVNLNVIFGIDFHEQPFMAWALPYLDPRSPHGGSLRMQVIYDEAMRRQEPR